MLKLIAFMLFFGGGYVAFRGFTIEIVAENIMQQIYASIWIVGGLLMIVAASICGGIADLSDQITKLGRADK